MNKDIRAILEAVQAGNLSADEAMHKLKILPLKTSVLPKLICTPLRQGIAEVIYGAGKHRNRFDIIEVMRKTTGNCTHHEIDAKDGRCASKIVWQNSIIMPRQKSVLRNCLDRTVSARSS